MGVPRKDQVQRRLGNSPGRCLSSTLGQGGQVRSKSDSLLVFVLCQGNFSCIRGRCAAVGKAELGRVHRFPDL